MQIPFHHTCESNTLKDHLLEFYGVIHEIDKLVLKLLKSSENAVALGPYLDDALETFSNATETFVADYSKIFDTLKNWDKNKQEIHKTLEYSYKKRELNEELNQKENLKFERASFGLNCLSTPGCEILQIFSLAPLAEKFKVDFSTDARKLHTFITENPSLFGHKNHSQLDRFNIVKTQLETLPSLQPHREALNKDYTFKSLNFSMRPSKKMLEKANPQELGSAEQGLVPEQSSSVPLCIDITVLSQLKFGQNLGICCDPKWEQNPISFDLSENGWKGQIPLNTNWKFVILENGKVTRWEKGCNRLCGNQTQGFTVKAHEVHF